MPASDTMCNAIFRSPKLSRRKLNLVKDKLVDERLKRYQALLQEKGIDPNQITRTSEAGHHRKNNRSEPAIEKATTNIEHIPRGFEALMFAIYSITVLSLTEDECKEILGETRATLLPRYVAATKAALPRARFMSSTSIVVLQALVLHILSIRDAYHPRAVWSLTGVVICIAEGMGMCLDGTLLGLSPFEAEIRRHIWWQLRMHDFRAAELSGQAKFRDFELDETAPKKPANVSDSDLYPAMPQAAE
ncbi:MAG: hypothetical protein Q9181_000929 [Wetmoreana brouardii]